MKEWFIEFKKPVDIISTGFLSDDQYFRFPHPRDGSWRKREPRDRRGARKGRPYDPITRGKKPGTRRRGVPRGRPYGGFPHVGFHRFTGGYVGETGRNSVPLGLGDFAV